MLNVVFIINTMYAIISKNRMLLKIGYLTPCAV